jgi:hypothetical protein
MPELLRPPIADAYCESETLPLEPDGDRLKITLKGGLEGMLNEARDIERSPDAGDLFVQMKLVALRPALNGRRHRRSADCFQFKDDVDRSDQRAARCLLRLSASAPGSHR